MDAKCAIDRGMVWEIVTGSPVGQWVTARVGGILNEPGSAAIGLEHNGVLVAGVLYEHWNRKSLWCHIAIEGRMTPRFLAVIFDYAFNVCGVDKAIAPVGSDNLKSVALVTKMGFTEEGRLSNAQPNGDIILFTMTRDACRYLGDRYGKKCAIPAPCA